MGAAGYGLMGSTHVLLALLQACLAIAIAVVVRQALWAYSGGWAGAWGATGEGNVCLQVTPGSVNLCIYSHIVAGVGLVGAALALVTQCFSRGRGHRCCAATDVWLSALLAMWWAAGAATATVYGTRADDAAVPRQAARTAVWAMGWAAVGLWGTSAALAQLGRRAAGRPRTSSEAELSAAFSHQRYDDSPFRPPGKGGEAAQVEKASDYLRSLSPGARARSAGSSPQAGTKWAEARGAYMARVGRAVDVRPLENV